jgi:hypothetical protein
MQCTLPVITKNIVVGSNINVPVTLCELHPDDVTLVDNICAVLCALHDTVRIRDIVVERAKDNNLYCLNARLDNTTATEITNVDMQGIFEVNALRVASVSICISVQNESVIKIKIYSCTYPLTVSAVEIIHIKKKRRWTDIFS